MKALFVLMNTTSPSKPLNSTGTWTLAEICKANWVFPEPGLPHNSVIVFKGTPPSNRSSICLLNVVIC